MVAPAGWGWLLPPDAARARGRPRLRRGPGCADVAGAGRARCAGPARRPGADAGRPHHRHPRHAGADRAVRSRDPRRPGRMVPALQRAQRRLRPGQPAVPGRARRRRMGDFRPEGVDLRGPGCRQGHAAGPHGSRPVQACRHLLVRVRHGPAPGGGPASDRDDGPGPVQRGVHRRGPGARQCPDRRTQQRLEGGQHHSDGGAGIAGSVGPQAGGAHTRPQRRRAGPTGRRLRRPIDAGPRRRPRRWASTSGGGWSTWPARTAPSPAGCCATI